MIPLPYGDPPEKNGGLKLKSYVIQIKCERDVVVKTRSRTFVIESGEYIYVGSCGKNCFSRVKRHYSRKEKLFWHIDFLSEKCSVLAHFFFDVDEKELASMFSRELEFVPGFGCTDDNMSPSHLFKGNILIVGKLLYGL